jgi:hypothetical protein
MFLAVVAGGTGLRWWAGSSIGLSDVVGEFVIVVHHPTRSGG